MSIGDFSAAVDGLRTTCEQATTTISVLTETIERLDTKLRAGQARQAQAVNALLSGTGFSYLFEMWIAMANNDITDPDLGALEITMHTWAPASKDVDFGRLRKMIRKKLNIVRKQRGRDAKLTKDELDGILNEVMGR